MVKLNKPVQLTQMEVAAIASTTTALCDAIDDVQLDLKHTLLTQATIETKQETILNQLGGLTNSVTGPEGLISQMAVVRATLDQIEPQEIAVLSSKIASLEKINTEKKSQGNSDRSANIAVAAAILAGIAIAVTLLTQTPGCRASQPPPATKLTAPT